MCAKNPGIKVFAVEKIVNIIKTGGWWSTWSKQLLNFLFSYLHRLKKGKELRKEADVKEVETNIHLIKAPTGKSCF